MSDLIGVAKCHTLRLAGCIIGASEAAFKGVSAMALELTADNFDSEILQSNLPAMVDFWAPWCGPCRLMSPIVESIAERYQGKVKVAKVNVDENPQLAVRYSIMSIPTLLFFRNGQVVDKVIGLVPEHEIEERLNKLLGE